MDNIEREVREFANTFEQYFKSKLQAFEKTGRLKNSFSTTVERVGENYKITVFYADYGGIISDFSYRSNFKYQKESKIRKNRQKYRWWSRNFDKQYEAFVNEMLYHYTSNAIVKLYASLDFEQI